MTLETLKPLLSAMPPEAVRTPNLPMATALQEAHDVLELCREDRVYTALVTVGEPPDFVTELGERITAARQAQSEWVMVRDRSKSSELVALEVRANQLRSDLLAAGRWNLRGNRDAQATLSSIRAGEGVADLVQDLFDLAAVYDKYSDAFRHDRSFDAPTRVGEARDVARRLSSRTSERLDAEPAATRDLRDRAFTFLDDLVSEVRAGARYAFRADPEMAKRFTSRYRRRQRLGAKRGQVSTQVVEEEVVGDERGAA